LRVKSGVIKADVSTLEKSALYYDETKVEGLKIDIHIVYDDDGREIDLCAGEVSKNIDSKPKIGHGDSKLVRESKDLLD
ncbi:hypothetical protein K501DRAFT_134038, partial [Backusella circina FSU 941]